MIALVLLQLVTLDLGQAMPAAGGGFELRFPAPRETTSRHLRLRFDHKVRAELNGSALSGVAREFDILDPLGKSNRLWTASDPGRVRLLVTPRVYAESAAFFEDRAEVVVRNTLDNTANVAVTVRVAVDPSAVAAIPPNTSQTVIVRGAMGSASRREVWVDKDEEALEGAYRYSAFF